MSEERYRQYGSFYRNEKLQADIFQYGSRSDERDCCHYVV